MRIVIAGGTGFLGVPLAAALRADGHEVLVLTRRTGALPPGARTWQPDGGAGDWASVMRGAAAVINLAGESIAGGRWTAARKRRLHDSRVLATRSLATAIAAAAAPPPVFVSGSAVGYYGPHGDEEVTETEPPAADFLGRLGQAWEAEASAAASPRVRVVLLRTGLPLAADGGMLGGMLLPFRAGAGGPVGHGQQYVPWIHRQDWIDLVRWLLTCDAADGPVNATAPHPVTSNEFAATLGRVLRRPSLMRVPAFALRLTIGELADALLTGQRALPARAQALGFTFRWPELEPALRDVLGGQKVSA